MSVADQFDAVVSAARRTTASATKVYEQQMVVLAERVRVRAQDDRHRRGVTRDSVARGGAILLPADDVDLSPHSPIAGSALMADEADVAAVHGTTHNTEAADAVDKGTSGTHPERTDGADSSYENGWLTDR